VWVVVIGFGVLCILPARRWRATTQDRAPIQNVQPQARSWRIAKRTSAEEGSISAGAVSQNEGLDFSEAEQNLTHRRAWIDDSPRQAIVK
jgi:hypothetical protein